ncbi:hypothetical protein EGW08_007009 [Elysia chlorotica]|uniref:Ionotropic glutamate receptor C-terminal domain-containing protein n=1 Tax=Elysia chlorotica TaxID=188477 RepID=A0A433TUT1_ELYCH|nr:hypothetical protein EGW08_007009 [Elysia chlorotica]
MVDRESLRLLVLVAVWMGAMQNIVSANNNQDVVSVVVVARENGPGVPTETDIATEQVDCSAFGPWNITIGVKTVYVDDLQSFAAYNEGPQQYTFIESSVIKSPVIDAALEQGMRSTLDSEFFLVLEADENMPLMWCCHVAGNTSVVPEEEVDKDGYHTEFYSFINRDYQASPPIEEIPCPPSTALAASRLYEWRQAKERQAKLIMEITRRLEWKTFLILYQSQFEQQVRALTQLAAKDHAKVIMAEVERSEVAQGIMLRYFETSKDLNVVLVTSLDKAQEVFQMALALEPKIGKRISVSSLSRWLLFCQDGIVQSDNWMFSSIFDNIALITDHRHLGTGHQVMVEPDVQFVLTTLLYKTDRRELAAVGSVRYDWALDLQQDVFPNIKFGFNGRLFVVTTTSWTPYVYRHVGPDGNVTFSGFCVDMAAELSRTLNFTIRYTEPPDGYWGNDEGNGTWNGMVGQVEVDMVVAPMGITEAREAVIDFTSPFFYDDSAVILKKPDPNASKWRTYIDIFRQEVLWCVLSALLGGFAIISLLVVAEKFVYKSKQKVFANSYFGSFLYLYGAMLAQGGRNLPKSAAGRIFLSSWWLFCIVVAGTYSGNLIAVLTVTKDKPPFNTLKEMAEQNEYRFGTLKNSMWTELFKTSPRPEFQSIAEKMDRFYRDDPDIYHSSTALHLEKVHMHCYAYIADKGLFSSWLATNCDLILLKEKFFPGRYGIVLPNNSVYTKVFSDQVVKFYESGLLQVWVKKWWPQQTFCQGSLVTQARALSLVDMQSSFYVLAIGLGMSAVVLVLESAFSLLTQLMRYPLWPGGRRQVVGAAKQNGDNGKLQAGKTPTSGLRLRRI